MSDRFRVVEVRNRNAVHAYGTAGACRDWIAKQPHPQYSFVQPDGSFRPMQASEFMVQRKEGGEWVDAEPVAS